VPFAFAAIDSRAMRTASSAVSPRKQKAFMETAIMKIIARKISKHTILAAVALAVLFVCAVSAGANVTDLQKAMNGHVLQKGETTATYSLT
jgi:hypothetical protein